MSTPTLPRARLNTQLAFLVAGFGLACWAPLIPWVKARLALDDGVLGLGGALGALDVAINVHAIEVERRAQAPLMSGFHAMFSVGGLAGSLVMTLLLAQGTTAIVSAWVCAAAMGLALLVVRAGLWRVAPARVGPRWVRPRASVWGLAVLAALCFLVEGALLDWGALAVAAVTTTAYAGVLAGPALLGVLARQWGLAPMFWTLAALLAVVPLSARTVLRR